MSTNSAIEWTDTTWSPVTGCTRHSPGCDNCYAARMTFRLEKMGQQKYSGLTVLNPKGDRHFNGVVKLHEQELGVPLSWRKPRRVFVCSMSDLFHRDVPFEFIDKVFAVMALCPQHTFQVLTKRPERMAEYTTGVTFERLRKWMNLAADGGEHRPGAYSLTTMARRAKQGTEWEFRRTPPPPLPNVWLGTSVEDQQRADERIPHLLKCPAAVRFLSCEPLLGEIDLSARLLPPMHVNTRDERGMSQPLSVDTARALAQVARVAFKKYGGATLDWVIVGGESGGSKNSPARPCSVKWVRDIVKQCRAAGVACFVKQLGREPREPGITGAREGTVPLMLAGWPDETKILTYADPVTKEWLPGEVVLRDKKGGNESEWPRDLRVREMPTTHLQPQGTS